MESETQDDISTLNERPAKSKMNFTGVNDQDKVKSY